MLKLKKLTLAICSVALALSATVISAYAAYDVDITSGAKATSTYTTIRLNVPGISTTNSSTEANFSRSGTIKLAVKPKGVFSAYTARTIEDDDDNVIGLQSITGATVSPDVKVSPLSPDEYDILVVSWANSDPCFAPSGMFDIRCTYANSTTGGDASFTVLSDSVISTWDKNKGNIVMDDSFNANPYVYTVASQTTDITKTEPSVGPTKEVKALNYFTGDKLEEDDNADASDVAAAVYAQLIPADADTVYTKVNWSVTATEDGTANTAAKAKSYEQTVNVSGEAAYKFGLVIRGLAANVITAVDAALAQ